MMSRRAGNLRQIATIKIHRVNLFVAFFSFLPHKGNFGKEQARFAGCKS